MIKIEKCIKHFSDMPNGMEFGLDFPVEGEAPDCAPLFISGWVISGKPAETVEAFCGSKVVARATIIKNGGVALADERKYISFFASIDLCHLPDNYEFKIYVSWPNQRAHLFTISGCKTGSSTSQMDLVSVTSLGRSGSSALLGFLACHPEFAVYKPFRAEARYIRYWAACFYSLSSSSSWQVPVQHIPLDSEGSHWIFGNEDDSSIVETMEPHMHAWFKSRYTADLYRFFFDQINEHYKLVGRINNPQGNPRFICEKFSPIDWVKPRKSMKGFMKLFPNMKEIVLVRDFRDMFCSIKAYNQKRGIKAFGVDPYDSNATYIKERLAGRADLLLTHWENVKNRAFLFKYENFVSDPGKVMKDIFEYLGASAIDIPSLLEKASRLKPESQKYHQTSIDVKKSVGRFRQELSPEIIDLCNKTMERPLSEFGYED
ncbi:MAG: sulfotransferase [Nitrospinae bacterium]|nr:sulfotransferase [Nitrospinota bacterium]